MTYNQVKTTDTIDENKVQYGVFQWGPCIVHIRISEDFHEKLMK